MQNDKLFKGIQVKFKYFTNRYQHRHTFLPDLKGTFLILRSVTTDA